MGQRLIGRTAIVTGGARGIGRGVACLLAEEGANVVIADFGGNLDGSGGDSAPADDAVAEIRAAGGTAIADYGDVSKFADCQALVQRTLEAFGRVDILCHSAGNLRDRMIFNMSEEEWDSVIDVHLTGSFNLVRACVRPMIAQGWGRILLFSSGSGLGQSGQVNYAAAKEGMVGFARALAQELGPFGIAVNALYPGGLTRMVQSVPDTTWRIRAASGQTLTRANPNWERDPDNNAPPIVWLCTEAGAAVSGHVIRTGGAGASRYTVRRVIRTMDAPRRWRVAELQESVPKQLAARLFNPAPAGQAPRRGKDAPEA